MASRKSAARRAKRSKKRTKSSNLVLDPPEINSQDRQFVEDVAAKGGPVQSTSSGRNNSTDAKPTDNSATAKPEGGDSHSRKRTARTKGSGWLMKGTGPLIKVFRSQSLPAESPAITSETDFELLCTYNWSLTAPQSIYVPGAPPSWHLKELPMSLPRDTGTYFIDHNACLAPQYPFEPLFQALSVMRPDFNFMNVDLISNRNSLRKLFGFVTGRLHRSFRIDLQMVHETLFLIRREQHVREIVRATSNSGFGHNFEREFSTPQPGLENSISHHRVVRYALGNLNCVIRFEVDACCDNESNLQGFNEVGLDVPLLRDDDISTSFKPLSLSGNAELVKCENYQPTRVILGGYVIPSSRTAEIKAWSRGPRLQEVLPQLWFGRTPHLFCGVHANGHFTRVVTFDAAAQFSRWEGMHQVSLRKMARLITELREAAMGARDRRCVVIYNHKVRPTQLELHASLSKTHVLPQSIIESYWRQDKESG